MKKIVDFLSKYGIIIIIVLLLLNFMNQCSIKNSEKRIVKSMKEIVDNNRAQDSVMDIRVNELGMKFDRLEQNLEHKLDSTLISNSAVINSNKQTSDAINNKKQNIIIKMDK